MKTRMLIVGFILMSIVGNSQDKAATQASPYFSAIIVNNLDTSALWYQSLFDLKVRNLPDVPEAFRVAILESPALVLELIENRSWLDPKKILEGKPEGTHIRGFFKIGFKVPDMNAWISHLKKFNVTVDRIYKDASNKRNFLVPDPDGNLVQFFEKIPSVSHAQS
jgi:glyoxalase/bleomycin resistance protein/dioxygenase superfamily protein